MKKTFLIFFALIGLSHIALAGELKITNYGTTFNVVYKTGQLCDTKISIHDDNGNEIFSEVIRDMCHFIRPYNFSKLPYGKYTIMASNEFEKKTTKVSYRALEEVDLFFNVLKLKGNRYLLSVPKAAHGKISISIYGEQSGLLYTKSEPTKGDHASLYRIQNADPFEKIYFRVTNLQ